MNLTIDQMMQMQKNLHSLHSAEWSPLEPEFGKNTILYMIEEIGEVISIVKKKGDREVVDNPAVRDHFLEEMADVMMYYMDTLLRYHISADEISQAYQQKHNRNISRDYTEEYKEKYHG